MTVVIENILILNIFETENDDSCLWWKNDNYKGFLIQWWEETSPLFCIFFSEDIPGDKLHIPSFMEKHFFQVLKYQTHRYQEFLNTMFDLILRMTHKDVETST